MRQTLLLLTLFVIGCCPLFPTDESEEPPAVTATADPTQPAAAPAANCDIEQMVLGTWTREGFTEEYRAGGVYVLNGTEGTIRWLGPGRAFLDVGSLHAEYYIGLTNLNELIAIDPSRIGSHYTRASPSPAIDASCFDFSQRLTGTWVGGTFSETYAPGGGYRVNDLTGTWQLTAPGHLRVTTERGTGDYYAAVLSPSSMIAISQSSGAGTVYTRQ